MLRRTYSNCSLYDYMITMTILHFPVNTLYRWERRIWTWMESWTSWSSSCSFLWNLMNTFTAFSCCSPSATSSLYVFLQLPFSLSYVYHWHLYLKWSQWNIVATVTISAEGELFFCQRMSTVVMQSLALVQHSSPVPGAKLFISGDLRLQQKTPLPHRGLYNVYNVRTHRAAPFLFAHANFSTATEVFCYPLYTGKAEAEYNRLNRVHQKFMTERRLNVRRNLKKTCRRRK